MFRRREPVPFAFVAEADQFRSNVTPPPRERASFGQMAGRWLIGLTVVAGTRRLPAPRHAGAVAGPVARDDAALRGVRRALTGLPHPDPRRVVSAGHRLDNLTGHSPCVD